MLEGAWMLEEASKKCTTCSTHQDMAQNMYCLQIHLEQIRDQQHQHLDVFQMQHLTRTTFYQVANHTELHVFS